MLMANHSVIRDYETCMSACDLRIAFWHLTISIRNFTSMRFSSVVVTHLVTNLGYHTKKSDNYGRSPASLLGPVDRLNSYSQRVDTLIP